MNVAVENCVGCFVDSLVALTKKAPSGATLELQQVVDFAGCLLDSITLI
jgi:hypothetical protein